MEGPIYIIIKNRLNSLQNNFNCRDLEMDHLPYGIKSSLFPCLKSKALRIIGNLTKETETMTNVAHAKV